MKDLIYILWIIAELVKLSGLPLAINRWPRNPMVVIHSLKERFSLTMDCYPIFQLAGTYVTAQMGLQTLLDNSFRAVIFLAAI